MTVGRAGERSNVFILKRAVFCISSGSATTESTPAASACASTANCTTSVSGEPSTEPASSCSSTATTSTPPPAKSSAPSHQPQPPMPRHRPTHRRTQRTPQNEQNRTITQVRSVLNVSRHNTAPFYAKVAAISAMGQIRRRFALLFSSPCFGADAREYLAPGQINAVSRLHLFFK